MTVSAVSGSTETVDEWQDGHAAVRIPRTVCQKSRHSASGGGSGAGSPSTEEDRRFLRFVMARASHRQLAVALGDANPQVRRTLRLAARLPCRPR